MMKNLLGILLAICFTTVSSAQLISTIAGTGSAGFSGDGSSATSAQFDAPQDVAIDASGNVYIADATNHRIRKITATTGIINTIAGTGIAGYSGDGAAATLAKFNAPIGIALDKSGNIYVADNGNNCIRKITVATGIISTIAGTGTAGFSGDGSTATSAQLYAPYDLTIDTSNNIYIADVSNNRIRKITAATGIINTIAGTGTPGFSGDGSAATGAKLYQPFCVALDASNNLYITDASNNRIRKVTATTGVISSIAGTGAAGFSGDGGAATSASFNIPYSILVDASGNIYLTDFNNNRLRKITAATGIINTVAGTGIAGFSGDGGVASSAQINRAKGIAMDASGNIYIADEQNQRIRFICNSASVPLAPTVISPISYCSGSTVAALSAGGTNLKWYTSAAGGTGSIVAPTPNTSTLGTTTYYVSQSNICGESPRASIVVNVVATPTAPVATSPITYCSGDISVPLTASGSGLKWYTSATGGTGSTVAPTPNTSSVGTIVYYVSQGISSCESARTSITVNVNSTPLPPTIVSPVNYCIGSSASPLSASGTNLKWYTSASGGTATTTTPIPNTSLAGSVTYYVSQSSVSCESPRAAIVVNTNPKPSVSITTKTAPLFFHCKGDSITLKALVTPYGLNFSWKRNGVNIGGALSDSLSPSDNAIYTVVVNNGPNCTDSASVAVAQDSTLLFPTLSPTNVFICSGVSVVLYSTPTATGYSYNWNKNGVSLGLTTSTNSIAVNSAGSYTVKVSNSTGCSFISNVSVVSTYSPIPKPIIIKTGTVLNIPAGPYTYQWYRNNKPIAGATTSSFNLIYDGSYFAEETDLNGCSIFSDTTNIINLAIVDIDNNPTQIKLYPNPAQNIITIETVIPVNIVVSDITGRKLIVLQGTKQIDMSSYNDGLYLITISDQSGRIIKTEKINKFSK
jgi:sugar lactone lactonase YvrE